MNRKSSLTQWGIALPCIMVSAMWLAMDTVQAGFMTGKEVPTRTPSKEKDAPREPKTVNLRFQDQIERQRGLKPHNRYYVAMDVGALDIEIGDVRTRTRTHDGLPTGTSAKDEGTYLSLRGGYFWDNWGMDLEYSRYPSVTYISDPVLDTGPRYSYRSMNVSTGLFVNGEYDLWEWRRFRPYVGVGLGLIMTDSYIRTFTGRMDRRNMESLRPSWRYKLGVKYQYNRRWGFGLGYHTANLNYVKMHAPAERNARVRLKGFDHTADGMVLHLIYRF